MKWSLVLVVLISGCTHVTPECSAHGGPAWQELASQHFVVRTNLEPADARAATVQLERARAALLPAFPEAPSGAPLEVVLFRDAAQLQNVTGDPALDGTFTHDWAGPLLLMSKTGSMFDSTPQLRLVMHELAHYFAAQSLRRVPRWFAEGLAHYLETVTIDADAQTARRGRANQERLGEVLRWGILPVESLWAWVFNCPSSRCCVRTWPFARYASDASVIAFCGNCANALPHAERGSSPSASARMNRSSAGRCSLNKKCTQNHALAARCCSRPGCSS